MFIISYTSCDDNRDQDKKYLCFHRCVSFDIYGYYFEIFLKRKTRKKKRCGVLCVKNKNDKVYDDDQHSVSEMKTCYSFFEENHTNPSLCNTDDIITQFIDGHKAINIMIN